MSRVIEPGNSTHKPALKFRRRFHPLAAAISLGLLLITVYPQTVSVVRRQEQSPGTKLATTVNDAQLPDLSSLDTHSLIRESDRLGTAMHLRLPEYTYLQTRFSRERDQRGKLVEHVSTYEAYPIKVRGRHRHVISLISEDGAPISPKRLKKERERAVKVMEAAERESALQVSGALAASAEKYVTAGIGLSQAGEGVWVGVSQFLRHCRFRAPRYDRLADREMIALEIRSCAGNVDAPREQYLAGMAGVVWIDAADKVVARLEAWPSPATEQRPEMPAVLPEAETLVYEQMRLPNGLWVPKRIRLNAIGKAALFNGTDKDMTFEFSRYQHFSTAVTDIQSATLKPKS